MPNFDFLKNLFKAGMTKTQFVEAYKAQINATKQEGEDLSSQSIFTADNNAESVASDLFDMLNINKSENGEEEVLDADEIAKFANLDTTDGENNLTESDMNVLMKNYQSNLQSNLKVDTPENMYKKAMETPSSTGDPANTYLQSLSYQISALESLAANRSATSTQIIINYNAEINTLIQNDNSISDDLKAQYNKENNKLASLLSKQSSLERQIRKKQSDIESADGEYKNIQANIESAKASSDEGVDYSADLSSAEGNLSQLNQDLSSLQSDYASIGTQVTKSQQNLESLRKTIKSQSAGLKQKIEMVNRKIDAEQKACIADIEGYNKNISALRDAQTYAIQQVQASAAASASSSSSGNGDATYVYDENNYDEAAVSALEQRWAKKAGKLGNSDAERHQFFVKLTAIAKDLKCDPNSLLAIMNSECGLNPKATNKNGGATGLIQFMPATARGLGTTTDALRNMSAVDQLDYVAKFFQNAKSRYKMGDGAMSAADLYSLVFLPARANREVLTTKGEKYYSANAAVDIDGDGNISKSDLNKRIQKFMV